MDFIRKERSYNTPMQLVEKQIEPAISLPMLQSGNLQKMSFIEHAFTTRRGGVSQGEFSTLNFSMQRGDELKKVLENYRRLAAFFETTPQKIAVTRQTHTTNVRVITKEDCGKGIITPCDYTDVDALVTNEPGIVLGVFTADCVPILIVDPVHRAIGAAHSGWRGTIGEISARVLEVMRENYQTDSSECYAAIGPSICRDCYEVSEDVATLFIEHFSCEDKKMERDNLKKDVCQLIVTRGKKPGKYQLDLWLANRTVLEAAGIPSENIECTDLCTCENAGLLFSHRATGGRRGNLGAFLMIKESENG